MRLGPARRRRFHPWRSLWRAPGSPRVVLVFFALVFVVFTGVYPYFYTVNNPNENVRTYMTMAIVEDHTMRIDNVEARFGWVNDMAAVPEPNGERHLFSVKGPAVSFAGVPVYWAFRKLAPRLGLHVATDSSTAEEKQDWLRETTFALRLFVIQLPCFWFLVWLERWLRGTSADPALRLSCVAAAGLGTNYLGYSLMFASHAPFAVAAFLSFAITTDARARPVWQRSLRQAFGAGFFAGLATLLEYHAGPVSVCLALYALATFWRPSRYAMFGLGAAINAAALGYFQWRCFKSPFTTGHTMSENQLYKQLLSQGYNGIGKPDWDVFAKVSFDRGFGFFGTSPFMWLGLLAIPFAIVMGFGPERERIRRRDATIAWLLTMVVLWVTVSAAINWRGGWTVGPRYLGAAPPFFAFGALCAFETIAADSWSRRALIRGVAGGAALASILSIGVVGMHMNTIPEDFTRLFMQLTLPMSFEGFVPHHVLEWFGVKSGAFWYVAAACAIAAGATGAFAPCKERGWSWPLRASIAVAVFGLAMLPALSSPDAAPDATTRAGQVRSDLGEHARRSFVDMWRPQGRDRLTAARAAAATDGAKRPCDWVRVAELERLMGFGEAVRDEAKAGVSATSCDDVQMRISRLLMRRLTPAPAR